MDPIVGNSININQHHSGVARDRPPADKNPPSEPIVSCTQKSITELSSLSLEVKNTGEEIRGDVIARAEKLISDPNWLNDSTLDLLADRILSVEDI
jgi:hypothetical protein